jgi:formylglycine-generating enzyme required for sulfatase activity
MSLAAQPVFTEIQPRTRVQIPQEAGAAERPAENGEAARAAPVPSPASQVAAGIQMIDIPAGEFLMGSANGLADERPVHKVAVRAFRLGKYEVTFEQYDAYCRATQGRCPDDGGWGRGALPVVNVSWDEVHRLVQWLNTGTGRRFRLPSEAEWEYAARAGTTTDFPWGGRMKPAMANCDASCADGFAYTAPTGSFPPNAYGLHDMPGNVWEWTQDCYNSSYAGAPADGTPWTAGGCDVRVVRGGSWASGTPWLRSSDRDWERTAYQSGTRSRGFRLAEDP